MLIFSCASLSHRKLYMMGPFEIYGHMTNIVHSLLDEEGYRGYSLTHLPNCPLPIKTWNRKYTMRTSTKKEKISLNLCLWHSLAMVILQSSTSCLLSAIVGQSDWGYLHTQIRSTESQDITNNCFSNYGPRWQLI